MYFFFSNIFFFEVKKKAGLRLALEWKIKKIVCIL
jgi:hypothetical protein